MKFFSIVSLLLFISCKSTTSADIVTNQTSEEQAVPTLTEMYCSDIMESKFLTDSLNLSVTTIINYEVVQGCACIKFQYSGCRDGEALLIWNGKYKEDITRPEVLMNLMVKDAGNCDQLLTDSICYSMKKMQLIGNQVLVYINDKENNFLLNYNEKEGSKID